MEMEENKAIKGVEGGGDDNIHANTHSLFWTFDGEATVLAQAGAWLDILGLGRTECTCKSASVALDMVWKELCTKRFPGTPTALKKRIVAKCGSYRAVAKYETICVGRGMPREAGPVEAIDTEFDAEELTLMVEISVFGNILVSERLSAREVIRGLDTSPIFDYDLREPVILGNVGCMDTTLRAIQRRRYNRGVLPQCSCDSAPCYFSNLIANGFSTRVDLERPNGFCCLQSALKNAFCAKETYADPYYFLHTASSFLSGRKLSGRENLLMNVECSLKLRNTLKASTIERRLGDQNIHLCCYPHIRMDNEHTNIELCGFQFHVMTSSPEPSRGYTDFDKRVDKTVLIQHILEEVVGMPIQSTIR